MKRLMPLLLAACAAAAAGCGRSVPPAPATLPRGEVYRVRTAEPFTDNGSTTSVLLLSVEGGVLELDVLHRGATVSSASCTLEGSAFPDVLLRGTPPAEAVDILDLGLDELRRAAGGDTVHLALHASEDLPARLALDAYRRAVQTCAHPRVEFGLDGPWLAPPIAFLPVEGGFLRLADGCETLVTRVDAAGRILVDVPRRRLRSLPPRRRAEDRLVLLLSDMARRARPGRKPCLVVGAAADAPYRSLHYLLAASSHPRTGRSEFTVLAVLPPRASRGRPLR